MSAYRIAADIINGNRNDARVAIRIDQDPARLAVEVVATLAKSMGCSRALADGRNLLSVKEST